MADWELIRDKALCKHQWKLLSETMTKSKLEHCASLGYETKGHFAYSAMMRKHIQVFTCECGRFKRFVEKL